MTVEYSATGAATTKYTYDDYKRIKSIENPGHPTPETTNFYYGGGDSGLDDYTHADANVTRAVLPSGKVIKKVYDENKRLSTATAGYGTGDAATTAYTYDDVGNLATMTEPKYYPGGVHWSYFYDVRNRLQYVNDPISTDRNTDGYTTTYTYDNASNKKSERRANDLQVLDDTYDNMNRLTQMTVGQAPTASAITHYTWTKAGKVDTMTDPNGNVYNYDYDAQNRLATTTYPGGTTETRKYDFAGNLLNYKNRGGATQSFTYDTRNREKSYSWSSGTPQARALTYDDASRLTACDTASTHILFTYYNDNLKKSEEAWTSYYGDNVHRTTNYTYNADGDRATVAYPGAPLLSYSYTNRNQLAGVSSASDGSVVGYTYDDNGNPLTRTPGSNPASSFVFDAMNRVTKITHNFVGANGGAKIFNYTYDEVGNRSTVQREGGVADPLAYDKNSQLTSFSLAGAVTGLTYDASGNRTKVGSTTYAASNSLNQYTTVGGAPVTYGGNGNLKTYNGWTYTYDSMNRLTAADGPGGTYADFYYDGLGREVARGVSWTATRTISVYDGWERVAEYAAGGSTVLNRWVYGAGGDLVRSPLPQQIYYYPDASGSTSYLGNGSGLLLERYAYDLAGTPTFSNASGTVLPNGSAYGVNQLFTGQRWYDAASTISATAPICPASAAFSSPTQSDSLAMARISIAIVAIIQSIGRTFSD